MNKDLISETEVFLKQSFDNSEYLSLHPQAKAYRLEHSYRVANLGRRIALEEGFDETEIVIACLLHDISYCEKFGENGWKNHGRRAAQIARPFLAELGFTEDRISEMCYGIAIHVDDEADFDGTRTPFALTVGDADNIDRFDAYRVHETLSHDGFLEMSFEEKTAYIQTRLDKLRKFLNMPMGSRSAEKIWKERILFYITYYEKLLTQLNCSVGIV